MSPSLSTVRRLIAVAAPASATIAVSPHGASASPTLGGFDVRAVPERPTATPPAYSKLPLSAGRAVSREVRVGNSPRRPLRLLVSAVDGITGQPSGAVDANRQDPVRETARWVTPSVGSLSLAAGRRARIGLTVRVPEGTPAGQYLAGLAVEDAEPKVSSARPGFHVKQVHRTVVGVLVDVGAIDVQTFVKARLSGAKPISYGAKSMRVGAAGSVVVRVKADARLARRYRARPGKWRYFGRLTYRAGQHRFVVRFPMRRGRR